MWYAQRAREAQVLRLFIVKSQKATSSVWRRIAGFLTKVKAGQRIIRDYLVCKKARIRSLLVLMEHRG